jgi:hypothetical protein
LDRLIPQHIPEVGRANQPQFNLSSKHFRHRRIEVPSDAEVLTLGLMQGCLGVVTLKKAYLLLAYIYRSAFPRLCGRLHALWPLLTQLWQSSRDWNRSDLSSDVIDSKPIPVCRPICHGQVRLLREEGACFGKTNAGWFFGFKLHGLINITGAEETLILTPANWDDRYLDRLFSPSRQGLWNNLPLKVLHHKLCHAGIVSV